MFRRTSSDKLVKKIKLLLLKESAGPESGETREELFLRSVIDPRLTAEENVILMHKLLEVREAFITMILSNRVGSHDRDFVAG